MAIQLAFGNIIGLDIPLVFNSYPVIGAFMRKNFQEFL